MKATDIAKLSDRKIETIEWAIVAKALREAQQRLEEADGGRHTWLDAPVQIAEGRAKG